MPTELPVVVPAVLSSPGSPPLAYAVPVVVRPRTVVAAAAALEGDQRWRVSDLQEEVGQGLVATVQDAAKALPPRQIRLGSAHHAGVEVEAAGAALQVVLSEQLAHGAVSELARFDLVEDLRAEAPTVVAALEEGGVTVQLLSGDRSGGRRTYAPRQAGCIAGTAG